MKGFLLILGSIVLAGGILYAVLGPKPEWQPRGGTFEEGTSGIMGEARLGPTCPAEPRSEPGSGECADKPFVGTLELTNVDGTRVVKEFTTNAKGEFKIALPPGEYMFRNKPSAGPFPSCGKTGAVTVNGEGFVEVIVFCDTGIR